MDGSSSYSVLIKAIIDGSGVPAQLKAISANQTVTIKAQIVGGDQLKTSIGTLQNQLDGIKIKNADAFKNPEVNSMSNNVQRLIDNLKTGTGTIGETRVAMGQLRNQVSQVNESFRSTTTSADNFGTTLMKDIAKVSEWLIATTLIVGSIKELKQGVQYISDLNKEMTNIGMVTGQTTNQLAGMANQFNSMAKELGSTTLEVAKGATEFIRQGRSMADTMDLLSVSTKLSKLGNLEADDATSKLTATLLGYNLQASEAIKITDTLIGLDNAFASSTKEISAGMEKSSSMAKQAGVEYQNLASYITIAQATTQQSGETIGQAFNFLEALRYNS